MRRVRVAVVALVGVVAVYTAATVVLPALRFELHSPDLRIVIEVVGLCIALFTALALLLPDEGGAAPERNAFVAALLALGVSNAVFGVGPYLLDPQAAPGARTFYPWLVARYVAGLLFIAASIGRPRLGARAYVAGTLVVLVVADVAVLQLGARMPLPLPLIVAAERGGSLQVTVASPVQNLVIAVVPGLLFAAGAWFAWRVYLRTASGLYLWLSLALWIQVLAQANEVLYPTVLGPNVTSADVLRSLALIVLLVGALIKMRQLFLHRGHALAAQEQDMRAQAELLRSMRAFAEREETFRSMVVHELTTPIATLRAYVHALDAQLGEDLPGARRAFEGLHSEAGRLQQLVGRMEELRGIELGGLELVLQPTRLRTLLDDAARYLSALPGDHHAVVSCDDVRVTVDPVRIGQALRNLVANAARYAPARSPVLLEGRALSGQRVEIAVTDRGPGIPAEERERVVEKYARGRAGDSGAGTGLGLYLVRRIADAHGGTLRISDADPPPGCRVALELRQVP